MATTSATLMPNLKMYSSSQTSPMQQFVDFLFADETWSFFLTYRLQLGFACAALLVGLVLCVYAFSVADCYNPHTAMWRTQLVIDLLVAIGFVLDATSAFRFQEPFLYNKPMMSLPSANSNRVGAQFVVQPFDHTLENGTVADCVAQRPYLFIVLACRQWAALLVFIMGLERLLFVCYPLWFRSIRIRHGPINVFTLFFALFSTGIAYTNAMYVSPDEPVHFSCEVTWAFGKDYGWIFNGLVILPQLFGCFFCVLAAILIHRDQALRRFGGNRYKVLSERRKIRKIKWILLSCLLCIALPQTLLVALHLIAPYGLFQIKLLCSQLFLSKWLTNMGIYQLNSRFGRGILFMINQWWKNRRKARVNPNDSIVTAVSYHVPRQ